MSTAGHELASQLFFTGIVFQPASRLMCAYAMPQKIALCQGSAGQAVMHTAHPDARGGLAGPMIDIRQ